MAKFQLSTLAKTEFERQKVFRTPEEFLSAFPPEILQMHATPVDLVEDSEYYSDIVVDLPDKMGSKFASYVTDLFLQYLPIRGSLGKTAVTWKGIVTNLSEKVEESSKTCVVKLKKASPEQGRWVFSVSTPGSKDGPYLVTLVAEKKAQGKKVSTIDLKLACTCSFWKFQGPDYWASQEEYLAGKPKSNGKAPTVKDSGGVNRICKHVFAASKMFLAYKIK